MKFENNKAGLLSKTRQPEVIAKVDINTKINEIENKYTIK